MTAWSGRSADLIAAVCRELHELAKAEEERAAAEAAGTPYWSTCPTSVLAHRAAARALRADAERLEAEIRLHALAS